ncbi:DUF1294 domain-containing protein [Pseudomonas sp. DTU_2021_1001937_2_SI_NGA_ILE_001]|uniref:DUF1294 domain-containing protein n=1 Tax=Pseudomonas sp. DTU_2021_1001937_2_SI_NGA_ILE_001 TaxID=3077589 RepID=UPI0025EF47DD|nr:DUF1294 domain-containing protein [Pseudomonas sp. DTU_2021_1001937_2_SI_NGA_ILE_001]WNW10443.1 DUF1294 domain-containing protein [Pseudomonas sp. DTU_2021_1001937_2_SI_NGA_ILE_001]
MRAPRLKLLVWLALCALPVLGAASLWRVQGLWPVALAYLCMSLLALWLYRHDKRQAGQGGQRTPERRLHLVEALGGWPGALLAQQLYRHKTRKLSYQALFWLIVIVHQAVWVDWLLLDRRFSGLLL